VVRVIRRSREIRREAGRLAKALKSLPVDPQAGEILMPRERGRDAISI
jgi:hypothetical protein